MKIQTAFDKLPYEASQQIKGVMSDEGIENVSDLTIDLLKTEVLWTIEKTQMDIDEGEMSSKEGKSLIRKCNTWIKKYTNDKVGV